MFQTLFFNTFASPARVKWDISRKYNDTALSRSHCLWCWKSMLPLESQNTLVKTSLRHFPITYEAVTDTFMLHTNNRNPLLLFSQPHTSSNSRYTTICKFQYGVTIRVLDKHVWMMCLTTLSTWLLYVYFKSRAYFYMKKK